MSFAKFSFLIAFTFAALAVIAVAPLAEKQEQDDDAVKKPRWTYDEIVGDPEFLGYRKTWQVTILLAYFGDKGTIPDYKRLYPFDMLSATWITTKYYAFPNNIDDEHNACLLLNCVLSPSFVAALRDDSEIQIFLPQVCRYYVPLLGAQRDDGPNIWINYMNERIQRKPKKEGYYIPDVSLGVIGILSDKAPEKCGFTTSTGFAINSEHFTFDWIINRE